MLVYIDRLFGCRLFQSTDRSRFNTKQIALTMLTGLAMGLAADVAHVAVPKTNESVFYSLEFVLNVVLSYSITAVAPYLVMVSSSHKEKSS